MPPHGGGGDGADGGAAPLLGDGGAGSDAAAASAAALPPPPRWYTPKRLLLLFCVMQFMVYMDRGVIASTGVKGTRGGDGVAPSGIAGRFQLSEAQDGLLYSAFMVGLLFGSPAFAEASKYFTPMRVIAAGLAAWVVATAGCAASASFGVLLFFRCAVGLGEASFCSLASPFIDDAAPAGHTTRWLALFFMCIPVGVASGFILGKVMGDPLGWRAPFALISLLMVPFVVFCATAEPLALRGLPPPPGARRPASPAPPPRADGDAAAEDDAGASPPASPKPRSARALGRAFLADVLTLLRVPVFVPIGAAWAAHTATVGCYSYYGPKAAKEIFSLDAADTVFGALTVVTGIAGTFAGGVVLDRNRASVPAALQFCAVVCFAAFVLLMLAFQAPTLGGFIPLFALGELALFSVNAAVNAGVLWSVPPRLRSLAMSIMTIAIHIFGDVPAPPLVGRLQDALAASARGPDPNNWRISLGLVTCTLAVSGVLFLAAGRIAARRVGGPAGAPGGGHAAEEGRAGGDAHGGGARQHGEADGSAPLLPADADGGGGSGEDTFFSPLPRAASPGALRRAPR